MSDEEFREKNAALAIVSEGMLETTNNTTKSNQP